MVNGDRGITFVHINTRSIFRKIHQIESLYKDFDFILCSETWLDNRYTDNMVNIVNMRIFRCDRVSDLNDYTIRNIGAGICVYVGKKFKDFVKLYEDGTCITENYEILTLLISKPNFRNLAVICVYKPPKGKVQKLIDFFENYFIT